MIVKKYTCPSCGYTKAPTTHSKDSCDGLAVKIGDTWRCDACDSELDGDTKCTKCGKKLTKGGHWKEVDMQL